MSNIAKNGDMDRIRNNSESSTEHTMKIQTPNYGFDILQKLDKYRSSGMYTDAILCVGREEFPVHKNIMAVSSPYFNAMFSSRLRESHESKISFTDLSAATLKRIIDYSYSGSLDITQDNAQELLAAGNHLEYPNIVNACCEFLQNQIHVSNSLGIENIAQLHCCEKLREAANEFTRNNFSMVVECEEFLDIAKERLMRFISDDTIDVPKEEIVYEAVMNWIKYDLTSRQQYISEILSLVRLPNIDKKYLHNIKTNPLICNSKSCIDMIDDALIQKERGHDNCKRRSSKSLFQLHPRPSTIAREVIVSVGGVHSQIPQTVEMYDIHKDRWFYICDLPSSVTSCGVSVIDNYIVLTGGILNGHIIPDVWSYKHDRNSWIKSAPLLQPRARHAISVINGFLYIIGGETMTSYGRIAIANTIDCYDPINDQWSIVGKSPFPRTLSRVIAFCDSFAEVGGLQCDTAVNTIDCYNCNQQNHTVESSGAQYVLPQPIQFAQILVLDEIYYIIWEDTKKVLTLNPYKRTFCTLPEMNYSHIHSGAVVLDGKLFVIGGLVDSKPSNVIECYDPETNKWTVRSSMTQCRACFGCVTLVM